MRAPAHGAGAALAADAEAVRVDRVGDERVGGQRGHVVALLEEVRGDDAADAAAADDEEAGRNGGARRGRGVSLRGAMAMRLHYNGSSAARPATARSSGNAGAEVRGRAPARRGNRA